MGAMYHPYEGLLSCTKGLDIWEVEEMQRFIMATDSNMKSGLHLADWDLGNRFLGDTCQTPVRLEPWQPISTLYSSSNFPQHFTLFVSRLLFGSVRMVVSVAFPLYVW
jgi:hypothetical protein